MPIACGVCYMPASTSWPNSGDSDTWEGNDWHRVSGVGRELQTGDVPDGAEIAEEGSFRHGCHDPLTSFMESTQTDLSFDSLVQDSCHTCTHYVVCHQSRPILDVLPCCTEFLSISRCGLVLSGFGVPRSSGPSNFGQFNLLCCWEIATRRHMHGVGPFEQESGNIAAPDYSVPISLRCHFDR